MDYATALQGFFQLVKATTPIEAVVNARSARRLRDAAEPIAMHAVWCRLTNERLAELGLNFLTSYVWWYCTSFEKTIWLFKRYYR